MPDTSTVVFFAGVVVFALTARYLIRGERVRPAPRSRRAVTEDMVDVVQAMFPQIDREVIRQDLQNTRNIEETTTHLLTQTAIARRRATPPAPRNQNARNLPASLLKRYGVNPNDDIEKHTSGWQSTREEREAQLRAQRQNMILQARKRAAEKLFHD